jgi:hypothetical protein
MNSKLHLERPDERRYYTIANNHASNDWDDHIFFMGGTAFQVTTMWKETAATPISYVSMSLLESCLYDKVWTTTDTVNGFLIAPIDVIANLDAYPAHKSRITGADMRFSPIVFNGVFGNTILKHIVLDGNHRLAFAKLNHAGTIGVKYITEDQLKRCVR